MSEVNHPQKNVESSQPINGDHHNHENMDHSEHDGMGHGEPNTIGHDQHPKMVHDQQENINKDHSHHGNRSHENHSVTNASISHNMHHGTHSSHQGHFLVLFSVIIFISIGFYFFRKLKKDFHPNKTRINLFKFNFLKNSVHSKYFIFSIRLVPALIFLLVLLTGLFGSARGNLAAPFTWLFWWTLLIFFVAFGGKIFCMACPWDFFANLFQFGWFHKTKKSSFGLGLKWPKSLSTIHFASLFFIVFTWFELVGVATNSFVTALLGLSFVCAAVLIALIFKDRPFCRYLCPIGRISGIYAQFSPLEIRPKDLSVCASCKTKDCVKGTATSTRCPTGEIPYKLKENTYCTLCTECIRSCDKENMVLKARPLATDLLTHKKTNNDEILLVILILVLTFFHGLTMTPTWFKGTDYIESLFSVNYMAAFSVLMPIILFMSFLAFYGFSKLIGSARGVFVLIPLALGYHFGHNLMHLFNESLVLVSYLNDPFGWGWDLMGLKDFKAFPLLGHNSSQVLQFIFIIVGFYYSIKTIQARVKEQFLSHYFLAFAIALMGLWLITQPMIMRTMHG